MEWVIGLLTASPEAYAERIGPLLVSPDLEGRSGAMFDQKGNPILPSPKLTDASYRNGFIANSEALLGPDLVLLIGDLLEPFDGLPVERLLDRDVSHRSGRRRPMPVLLVWSDRDDVARSDLFDRTAPPLVKTPAEGDDQRLAERVGVPVAARARFERHVRGAGPPRRTGLEQRIEPDVSREVLGRPHGRRTRTVS
jgi:hypothetical protein